MQWCLLKSNALIRGEIKALNANGSNHKFWSRKITSKLNTNTIISFDIAELSFFYGLCMKTAAELS